MGGGSRAFLLPGKDYSEAEALIMTFSLNNYPPGDPKLAQAKLWEGAFLEEMRAFQRRTAGVFQVTFMAEVGAAGSLALGQTVQVVLVGSCIPIVPSPLPSDPELPGACPGGWGDATAVLAAMSELTRTHIHGALWPSSWVSGSGRVCVHSVPWRMRSTAPRPRTCPSLLLATLSSSCTSPWPWAATPAGVGYR